MFPTDYFQLRRIGSYRVAHLVQLVNVQEANSRLFEIRNAATDPARVLVPRQMRVEWIQNNAHTAFILAFLALYFHNGFTVVDPTDDVVLTGVPLKSSFPAEPGSAEVRGLTSTGVAAGMTGGTVGANLGGSPLSQMMQGFQTAVPTTPFLVPQMKDLVALRSDQQPVMVGPDEGLILMNSTLLGAAAGSRVSIELEWDECYITGIRA